ncbi:MAG TPA: Fe-S cluster assembly protein SufD [Terriglobia bacterium]
MPEVMEQQDLYLESFRQRVGRREPEWLARMRQEAIESFADYGFPTPQQEEWRFTNVAPITRVPFQPAGRDSIHCAAELMEAAFLPGDFAARLVFINGHFSPQFSQVASAASAIEVGSIETALAGSEAWLQAYLARSADFRRHPFAALNTAFWEDGAYVRIPKEVAIEKPVHLVFVSASKEEPLVSYPRTLVVAERDAQATVVESYVGLNGGLSFSNAVSEIVAGENAVIDHYRVQRENERSFHVGTLQVYQARSAQFSSCSVGLGGALVRTDVNAVLDAEGAECALNGLYVALGEEHVDNHTTLDHAKPHGSSRQLYNGILGGKATAVFNGRVLVRPDAQKTDAIQKNRNLLLSPEATIDTKPQLEIFANDVRCTHGATIGQLDPEALFYLRSRGVGSDQARELLIYAFAGEILDRVRPEPLRGWVEKALRGRLSAGR